MKRVINGKTYSKVLGIKQGSLLTAGKDGDIEEYKADPSDAGKVLTVGEDGGIAPAGGGVKLYSHIYNYQSATISGTSLNMYFPPFTLTRPDHFTPDSLIQFINNITSGYTYIPASGKFGTSDVGFVTGITGKIIVYDTGFNLLCEITPSVIGLTYSVSAI